MANYLSRPVFETAIDWAEQPDASISFDLAEVALGFGPEEFWADGTTTIDGWQFEVRLNTAAEIEAFHSFFEVLAGRLVGFWLPVPRDVFRITDNVSSSVLTIEDCGLAQSFGEDGEIHVRFTKSGQTAICAKVTAAVDNLDGTEDVTLSVNVSTVDETWKATSLRYVRLADDQESGEFEAENKLLATVKAIALPYEYASYETGTKPIYLYHFWTSTEDWYLTSFDWGLVVGVDEWEFANVTHDAIESSAQRDARSVRISARFTEDSPLWLMFPANLSEPLNVEIKTCDFDSVNAQTLLFTGVVLRVIPSGGVAVAECSSVADVAGGDLPGFQFQPRCQYRLGAANTCRVTLATFTHAASVSSVSDRTVVINGAALAGLAAKYFAQGQLVRGSGSTLEIRTILGSTAADGSNNVTLTLNIAPIRTVATDSVSVIAGCDRRFETCRDKFSNQVNFGGHRAALRNFTLKALDVPQNSGGKK